MRREGSEKKIKFILDKVVEERGHIGVVGPIQYVKYRKRRARDEDDEEHVPLAEDLSSISDISIYPDGRLKYSLNGRERANPMRLSEVLPEILEGIYLAVSNNKYL